MVIAALSDEDVDPLQSRLVGRLQSVRHYPGQPCHRLGQGEGIGHVRTIEAEHLIGHNGGQGREQHHKNENHQASANQNFVQGVAQRPGGGEHGSPGPAGGGARSNLGNSLASFHPSFYQSSGGIGHSRGSAGGS